MLRIYKGVALRAKRLWRAAAHERKVHLQSQDIQSGATGGGAAL
jgi:hypothetical protein